MKRAVVFLLMSIALAACAAPAAPAAPTSPQVFGIHLIEPCGAPLSYPSFVWSPDGSKIAINSRSSAGNQIDVMDAAGGQLTRLAGPSPSAYSPDWVTGPDLAGHGGQIVFMTETNSSLQFAVINADGSGLASFTPTSGPYYTPQWSPLPGADAKGRQILFTSGQGAVTGISLVNADGSGVTRLTSGPGTDYTPAWSPDGARIAYVSAGAGGRGLFLINHDGSGKVKLVDHAAQYPAWSPDGRMLAYVAPYQGASGIYVVDADPESPDFGVATPLTAATTIISAPVWSADGGGIIFDARQSANAAIFRVALDGSGQTALTNSKQDDTSPAVSPVPGAAGDGTKIAFLSNRDGPGAEIYVMDADGSHQNRLTSNPGNQKCLSWPF